MLTTTRTIRTATTTLPQTRFGCEIGDYWHSVTAHALPIVDDNSSGIRYAATVRSVDSIHDVRRYDLSILVDNGGHVIVGDDRHVYATGVWWDCKADGNVDIETDDMPDEATWLGLFCVGASDDLIDDLQAHAHNVLYYGIRRALSACAAIDPLYQRWMAIAAGEDPDECEVPSPDFPEWNDDHPFAEQGGAS
jgi:hypothetical protein